MNQSTERLVELLREVKQSARESAVIVLLQLAPC
jgi:hypothetical protein